MLTHCEATSQLWTGAWNGVSRDEKRAQGTHALLTPSAACARTDDAATATKGTR